MNKILLTIKSKGEGYTSDVVQHEDGSLSWVGDFDVDVDGSGPNLHHDPFFQPDTTLHHNGQALNAEKVAFGVVPPDIINAVPGIVMGCKMTVEYRGHEEDAVVGDQGPRSKLGEGSAELARRLGINDNPNNGGVDLPRCVYRIWPGVPAVVDGVTYQLQPA